MRQVGWVERVGSSGDCGKVDRAAANQLSLGGQAGLWLRLLIFQE